MLKNKLLIIALFSSLILHFLLLGGWAVFFRIIPRDFDYLEFILMQYKKTAAFEAMKGESENGKVRVPAAKPVEALKPEQEETPREIQPAKTVEAPKPIEVPKTVETPQPKQVEPPPREVSREKEAVIEQKPAQNVQANKEGSVGLYGRKSNQEETPREVLPVKEPAVIQKPVPRSIAQERDVEEVRPVTKATGKIGVETEISWEEIPESEIRTSDVVISYKKLLQELIIQYLEYPKKEREKGIKGEVVVTFIVLRDGKLKEVVIPEQNRSPVESFNSASVEAVKQASPYFPPFPPDCKENEIRFIVKIHFD